MFLSFIGLIISISALVYLCKIRSDTSIDVFQQPFEEGKKEKLFYPNDSSVYSDLCLKCELYQNSIMNPKVTKLGDFFELNIEKIHSRANILLLLFILMIVFLFLTFFSLFLYSKTKSLWFICLSCIVTLGNIFLVVFNFIFTILLLVAYYNGDTYRFVEFLSCKNVNREEFGNYLFAEKLKKDFTIFVILNIINLIMNSRVNSSTKTNNQKEQNNNQGIELEETK